MYIDKWDLALNNLQELICHKTQPNNFKKDRGGKSINHISYSFSNIFVVGVKKFKGR